MKIAITQCLRGHKYTKANTILSVGNSGKSQRSCKKCRNLRIRLKYQNNEEFRLKQQAKSLLYKQRKKSASNKTLGENRAAEH